MSFCLEAKVDHQNDGHLEHGGFAARTGLPSGFAVRRGRILFPTDLTLCEISDTRLPRVGPNPSYMGRIPGAYLRYHGPSGGHRARVPIPHSTLVQEVALPRHEIDGSRCSV